MYCAICKKQIVGKFTNPESHAPDCPIFVDTQTLVNIIVKEVDKTAHA